MLPSSEKATLLIQSKFPSRVWSSCPVATFHTNIVSRDLATSFLPSGEKATLLIQAEFSIVCHAVL
jgi:hypothetical protein